jgi:hypothetical protein
MAVDDRDRQVGLHSRVQAIADLIAQCDAGSMHHARREEHLVLVFHRDDSDTSAYHWRMAALGYAVTTPGYALRSGEAFAEGPCEIDLVP